MGEWRPDRPHPTTPDGWEQELLLWGQQVEAFHRELLREQYLHDAGLKDTLELSPIYERWAALFSPQAVDRARALTGSAPSPAIRKRMRFLWEFTASGFLGQAVRELVDQLGTREAQASARVDGEEIPYRALSVRMAGEPDRRRRQRLQQARDEITAALNPLRERIAETQQAAVRDQLGFASYADMYRELKGVDYDHMARAMRQLLSATQAAYEQRFGPALEAAAGVGLGQAEKHDVARLLRAASLDGLFPAERLVASLNQTLADMGLTLSEGRVHLDTEVRPHKSPRAFCAPVQVPWDVRLVILPQGGQDDYRALMHEAGHALHFAHCRPDLPAEFRYLGDNSVTECFAFLMEHLVTDPEWLQRYLGLTPLQAGQYADFARLDRLYFVRRYAGKLLYELELHRAASVAPMARRYREILTEATGVRYGEVDYLADVDDAFYVAEYLRAWALEVWLRRRLRERFGRRWFCEPRAGRFLQELWAQGQSLDGEELARQLGSATVDFGPLVEELIAGEAG